jgi:ABC-type uncharacterized transport system substrate-binding protein
MAKARGITQDLVTTNIIAKAVQQATPQSPIVMLVAEEPVTSGLVQSLAHPGGTITGMAMVPGAAIYPPFRTEGLIWRHFYR